MCAANELTGGAQRKGRDARKGVFGYRGLCGFRKAILRCTLLQSGDSLRVLRLELFE
jgi:hypothetical protein